MAAPAKAGPVKRASQSRGGAPARKGAAVHSFRVPYRYDLKAAEIVHPIGVCLKCYKVVEPFARRYSKTVAQGEWLYVHKHPLAFVVLEQDSSGKRGVRTVGGVPSSLAHLVKEAWVEHGADIYFVEDAVKEWLRLAKEGREEDLVITEVDGVVQLTVAGDW